MMFSITDLVIIIAVVFTYYSCTDTVINIGEPKKRKRERMQNAHTTSLGAHIS